MVNTILLATIVFGTYLFTSRECIVAADRVINSPQLVRLALVRPEMHPLRRPSEAMPYFLR